MSRLATDTNVGVETKKGSKPNTTLLVVIATAIITVVAAIVQPGKTTSTTPNQGAPESAQSYVQTTTDPQREQPVQKDPGFAPVTGIMQISPEVLDVKYMELQPKILIEVNIAYQNLVELAQHDANLLDAFLRGDTWTIDSEAQWIRNAAQTQPDAELLRQVLISDYDYVARDGGMGLSVAEWVKNTANVMRALGDENRAGLLERDLEIAIQNELAVYNQKAQAGSTTGSLQSHAPDTSAQPLNSQANGEQVRIDQFTPNIVTSNGNLLAQPPVIVGQNGIGLSYNRPQILYSLKRMWAFIWGAQTPGRPQANCVVDITFRNLPPSYDQTSAQVFGLSFYHVQLILAEDCGIQLPRDTDAHILRTTWGVLDEGYAPCANGGNCYWTASEFILVFGPGDLPENQFPYKIGSIIPRGTTLLGLLGME